MPWGIVAGAAIGAIGSVVSSNTQADAQKQAASTQADMFNKITANEQPYLTSGNNAESSLNELLGTSPTTGANSTAGNTGLPGGYLTQTFNPTMSDLENTPGYQFALSQGGKATTSAQTPGSGALSGSALKSLTSFNQGLASTQYQNSFNNFQTQQNNIFNRLNSIASLGQNAAGNLGNNGASLGSGIAQAQAAAGASQAAGINGAASNIGSALTIAGLTQGQGTQAPSGGWLSGGGPDSSNSADANYSGQYQGSLGGS